MHVTVRRHDKVSNPDGMGRHGNDSSMSLISGVPGFVAYYVSSAGDGTMFSTGIFRDAAGGEAANVKTAEWIEQHPVRPSPVARPSLE